MALNDEGRANDWSNQPTSFKNGRIVGIENIGIYSEFVWAVIINDLQPLLAATDHFLTNIYEIIPMDESHISYTHTTISYNLHIKSYKNICL